MNLNDLKREHNALQDKARKQYAKVLRTSHRIDGLRAQIKFIEGDDFDPVPLIFGGDLNIYDDGESIEIPNPEKSKALP